MIQTVSSSTAETAFHKIWEDLRVIEEDGLSEEGRRAIARHSDTEIPLTEMVIETSKRTFYSIWEKLDPKSYLAAAWVEDEFWSGRALPCQLPRLRPRKWQAMAKSLAEELPSNERLEHWNNRLFFLGFSTIISEPEHLSFAVGVEWDLAQGLLDQLRHLADLSRNTKVRLSNVDPLEDVHPSVRFVFRCTPKMVVIRYSHKQRCFRFRRQPRGFIYLHMLLQNPDKELTLFDILGSPTESREERYNKLESLWVRSYNDHEQETKAFRPQEGFKPQALADMESLRNVVTVHGVSGFSGPYRVELP